MARAEVDDTALAATREGAASEMVDRTRSYTPTAAELDAFAGRWGNAELGAVFTIESGERGLLVRLNGGPPAGIEFAPVDTDTFQFAQMILRFQRDADGNVVGLDHSNPVMRNVPFTRR